MLKICYDRMWFVPWLNFLNYSVLNRPFSLGRFVAHVMILLRILAFKFSNSRVYMNEYFLCG